MQQVDCDSAPLVSHSRIQAKGVAPKWEAGHHKGLMLEGGTSIPSAPIPLTKADPTGMEKGLLHREVLHVT